MEIAAVGQPGIISGNTRACLK
jgi:hypothetical protein